MRQKPALFSFAVFTALSVVFLEFVALPPSSTIATAIQRSVVIQQTESAVLQPISGQKLFQKKTSRSANEIATWAEPKVVFARPQLDVNDEIATLRALQLALNEVGDGSTYVWHRNNGRLSGIVKPTASFRDNTGQVCRHIVVWLTAGTHTKKTETIACRQNNRVWTLEG